jgi:hypothetical protein
MQLHKNEFSEKLVWFFLLIGRMTPAYSKYLRALNECLHNFTDDTTALIINKMPRQGTLNRDNGRSSSRTVAECERQEKDAVFSVLNGNNEPFNVVTIHNDPTDEELMEFAQKIYSMVLRSGEIDKTHLKTWTERLNHYQAVVDGKLSADNAVAWRQNELQSRINQLEKDIQWHRNRIHDLTIATASTSWIPIFGSIAGSGMVIAIADSECKLGNLMPELALVQGELKQVNCQKSHAEEEVRRAQDELNRMENIFK